MNVFTTRWRALLLLLALAPARAAEIEVDPSRGILAHILRNEKHLRVTFPTPMVSTDALGPQRCPLVFDPPIEVDWVWKSQTEGWLIAPTDFSVGAPAFLRRIMYRARLRDGLLDLAKRPVVPKNWGVQFADDTFAISAIQFLNVVRKEVPMDEEEPADASADKDAPENPDKYIEARSDDASLPARPRVRIEFTRNVAVKEAERHIFFQDTESRERHPVEATVEGALKETAQGWIVVEPVRPLPAERTFYLVIDRFAEPAEKKLLPVQKIIPAGSTRPLTLSKIAGFHQPGEGAYVRIRANKPLASDAAAPGQVSVTPAVAELRVTHHPKNPRCLELRGRFDPKAVYQVAVKAGIKSVDGFALARESKWTVRFPAKRPAVIIHEPVLFQRVTADGVRVPLVQINTGPLTWKVDTIPPELFETVRDRLREFGEFQRDEKEQPLTDEEKGEHLRVATELFIDGEPLGSGTLPASSGDAETPREIQWQPPGRGAGLFLFEVAGKDAAGRTVGNRVIVSRSDWVVTKVTSAAACTVRVAQMGDGRPAAGVPVEVWWKDKRKVGPLLTDARGEARFKDGGEEWWSALAIFAGQPGAQCLQWNNRPTFRDGAIGANANEPADTGIILTDRNLYRPGETVKIYGVSRTLAGERLKLPKPGKIEWNVMATDDENEGDTAHDGTATMSKTGSWEATWKIPASLLGAFRISGGGGNVDIAVAEYRPLPFSVKVESADTYGETVTAQVTSAFFHGAPNAKATVRWKAIWSVKDLASTSAVEEHRVLIRLKPGEEEAELIVNDHYSPDSPQRGISAYVLASTAKAGWDITHDTGQSRQAGHSETQSGTAVLDAQGRVTLTSKSPFARAAHRRATVTWIVDVLSEGAREVRGGDDALVQFAPQILGANLVATGEDGVQIQIASFDRENAAGSGLAVKAELFHVAVKTVKEPIPGSQVNRYRNFPEFTPVWQKNLVTPAAERVPVTRPGQYILRVTAPGQPLVSQVSARTLVGGEEETFLPVENDAHLAVRVDRTRYHMDETASLSIEAPFAGTAYITVAAREILARETVEIRGNAQRVPLKILPAFAPNAHVLVHLIKAAGAAGAPAERFGSCEFSVEPPTRPEAVIEVARDSVEPGAEIAGVLRVRAGGKPLAGAEVLLFAADDAVLELGRWAGPDFESTFFPLRPLNVSTSSAGLGDFTPAAARGIPSLAQKGFILGSSGLLKGMGADPFERFYKAFDFWKAGLITDAAGEVRFAFKAPQALTRARVIAIAHRGPDQFAFAQQTVTLAKHLQVEPILPEFVRRGDEVSLRATVQQDYAESDEVEITLERAGSALQPLDPTPLRKTLRRGQRETIGFRAKVVPGPDSARVLFTAKSLAQPAMRDSEDNTIQVRSTVIEVRETKSGLLTGTPFDAAAARDPRWSDGRCDVFLSSSSYLPKLAGLPKLVEARGSLERLSAQLLAGTLLAESMAFLPRDAQEEEKFRASLEGSLRVFEQAITDDNRLPAWPGATEPQDFVTIQAAWAVLNARQSKLAVRERLARKLSEALVDCVRRAGSFRKASADVRCFALMVFARTRAAEDELDPSLLAEVDEMLTPDLTDEGRAWLALALQSLRQRRDVRDRLLTQLGPLAAPPPGAAPAGFHAPTFRTATREQALRLLAQSEINSTNWTPAQRRAALEALNRLQQSSLDLSSQENLWLLLVFNSMARGEAIQALKAGALVPKPPLVSANAKSAGWLGVPLDEFATHFPAPLRPGVRGSYLLRATYAPAGGAVRAPDASLNLTRSARLLQPAGARDGSVQSPWKLGDHVLVTFTINADRPHSCLELEDLLPACFETVNPQLPLIREYFKLPIETGAQTLALANSELRADRTVLYFEQTQPGRNVYGVLARVTTPGVFHWPPTQVRPMYDSRFGGVSEAAVIHAVE